MAFDNTSAKANCLMLHFVFISITINLCSSTIQSSNETDSQALMGIKDLIKDDPFNILSSWNHSTHLCQWEGITCSSQKQYHHRVVAIDLPSFELSGSLSPAIGNLTFLMKIDLGNNTLHGFIPQEIGRLSHLQFLYLPYNNFSGELPVNLTNCLNIKVIYLLQNNLLGKIPYQLGSLSRLQDLVLGNNEFIGAIPSSFGNLSALTQLSLMNNKLDGTIPLEMEKLSKLKFLQLSGNNLSGMVPYGLYNITSIYHFDIAMNSLEGTLPLDLGWTLPKLESFFVGRNQFYGSIPSSIANASKLVELSFSYNAFTGPLPKNFGYLHDLQILYASGNNLGNSSTVEELSVFLTSLSNCTSIQRLALKDNSLRGSLHPNAIGNLSTTFTYLILGQNYIYGNIPSTIGELVNLQFLGLDENMLHGALPNSLGKLSQLDQLYISSNNISGEIPSSFGNFSKLSILSLYDNMLEGTIPVSLSRCLNLKGMDLSYNLLTGTLPAQIAGISSLNGIILNDNLLVGPLPQEISHLMNLGILVISENQFSGEIPASLGSCLVLETLLMQGNLLEGAIPASFEQLRGLQILDLSRNNLSGPVPSFLGEFSFLQTLNLSNNNFEGEVPTEGVFKNITAFSVAGDNKLCGGIKALQLPPCPSSKVPHKKFSRNNKLIISVVVPLVVLLLLCLSVLVFFLIRRRKRKQNSPSSPSQETYLRVTYAELQKATDGFSMENLIGQGQHGTVYKGTLSDQTVAIKVLNLQEHGSDKSFLAECEALRNLRHRNLVKIITICSSIDLKGKDFKALVFQFMENGSLESWLHPNPTTELVVKKKLNLLQRINIAIDVASVLDYLHHQCESVVAHCDLKPSNVLLDNDFCAHVSDFGIAKVLLSGSYSNQQSSSIAVRGTVGYVAPEYGIGMEISTQGDMYSYGILLLELLTGKRPTSEEMNDSCSLHSYVNHFLPDRVMEIVDPDMIIWDESEKINANDENKGSHMIKFKANIALMLQIGVCCSAHSPTERMNAGDVLDKLHKVKTMFLT